MAEIAAHLTDHVFPQVPVTIETGLRRRCPGAPRGARCGAVCFVQRFGAALNAHTHLHCCLTDGVFRVDATGTLRFHPAADLDEIAVGAVQRRIRTRVLRAAVRHGAFSPEVAADLARWDHGGGFPLHATVRIAAQDRAGLERLLRYCARPAFASERLAWNGHDQPVRYTLPKPLPSGQTTLALAPRARDPPAFEAAWAGTPGFAFDQSPPWDPTTPALDPGFSFDQTLN